MHFKEQFTKINWINQTPIISKTFDGKNHRKFLLTPIRLNMNKNLNQMKIKAQIINYIKILSIPSPLEGIRNGEKQAFVPSSVRRMNASCE